MKVIELTDRVLFLDDIIQIYKEDNYCPIRYHIQTNNGTYRITSEDYNKIQDYLLSLNEKVEIIEEEPRNIEVCGTLFTKSEYDRLTQIGEEKKIPEKLPNKFHYTDEEENFANKINEIIKYLKSKEK